MNLAAAVNHALAVRAREGTPGVAAGRLLARGSGWAVHDVVCTCSPDDRPFEEQHSAMTIALVVAGTFQYRAAGPRALMTPGALLLGNDREPFECGHQHGAGDRCVSFRYSSEYFDDAIAGTELNGTAARFDRTHVPVTPALSPVAARVCANLLSGCPQDWEELGVDLIAGVARHLRRPSARGTPAASAVERRVSDIARWIEREPALPHSLCSLARMAGASPFHFLRTFQRIAGESPHQYVMRTRLREAATRLLTDTETRVVDVALDCGFRDVSNFNHAFKREFGVSPRRYRTRGPIRGR